jgi:hypothetical protein
MRNRPISININGVDTCLHAYLLTMPDRPIPKAPTHYLVVDILNRDLSIKRVTIYFNPDDTWTNPDNQFEPYRIKWIGNFIGEHLGFLGHDPNTIAYVFWVIEVATDQLIYKSSMYDYCDWDAA